MEKTANTYTYAMFGKDIVSLAKGELELTPELSVKLITKAQALITAQEKKAAYNAAHPSKTKPKGASDATKALADKISAVLSTTPMTAAEIGTAIGEADIPALRVSNAVRYIEGVKSTKVIRDAVNNKGLKSQREYTAYSL